MSQADNLAALATNVNSSGVLQPASGGTGLTSPGTNGNVLTSNGTAWVSSTPGTYSQWTTTGSDIYYNTGNVGIGTSSPSYPLQVVKNANGAQRVLFSNNSSGISAETVIAVSNGTAEGSIRVAGTSYAGYGAYTANNTLVYNDTSAITIMADNATNGIIKFATGSNSERMRIDSSGNVGIGVSSPGQKLDVSTTGDIQLRLGNAATGAQFTYDIGRVAATGLLQFYGNQSGATGYIFSGVNGERMRIDSSGNVGIGTSSYSDRFIVMGGARANTGIIASLGAGATSAAACKLHFSDTWSWNWTVGGNSAGAFVFTSGEYGTLTGTERMRITSGGNVGIGTSSPSFTVDVLGGSGNNTMRLRGTGGSTTLRIDTDTDSASNRNWAFRNRYNAFGRLELMRGTTNSDDPLTTTMYWNNDGSTYVNGDFYFNSGYGGAAIAYGCRAWVNFNGLAGASIRASGNISSVTFVSTGNYTVNFTTAMPDANYCVTACNSGSFGANWGIINVNITGSGATEVVPTTSSFAVEIVQPSTARIDSKYIHLAVFR